MRSRTLVAVLSVVAMLVSFVPAAAVAASGPSPAISADYTWGYNAQRTRLTAQVQPMATLAEYGSCTLGSSSSTCTEREPYITPLPGVSTSTQISPPGLGGLIDFTHTSTTGWLWKIPVYEKTSKKTGLIEGQPGQAVALLPMAARGPMVSFNAPSDASMSPNEHWLAFGAGDYLYWKAWPSGNWNDQQITSPSGLTSMVSMAPVFVPGASGASQYVCEGNWNGAFDCFDLQTGTEVVKYWTSGNNHPADTSASITSSPALVPGSDGNSKVCFGIASFQAPRVVCVTPALGVSQQPQSFGAGEVYNPIAASTVYDAQNNSLLVTDQAGNVYRFDAASGQLLAFEPNPVWSPQLTIVSPALTPNGNMWIGVDGASALCEINATTFQPTYLNECTQYNIHQAASGKAAISGLIVGGGNDVTSPTEVSMSGQANEAWAFLSDGVLLIQQANGGGDTQYSVAAPNQYGSFSAVTVGVGPANSIAVYGSTATTTWKNSGIPLSFIAAPPAGFNLSQTQGGIELWNTAPLLLGWVSSSPVFAGDGKNKPSTYYVYALSGYPMKPKSGQLLTSSTEAITGSVNAYGIPGQQNPVPGVTHYGGQLMIYDQRATFSSTVPLWTGAVMPNPESTSESIPATLGGLLQLYNMYNSGPVHNTHAPIDGSPPTIFSDWELWRFGPFTAPAVPGRYTITLMAGNTAGVPSVAYPSLFVICPLGDTTTSTGCIPPPPPPPTCKTGTTLVDNGTLPNGQTRWDCIPSNLPPNPSGGSGTSSKPWVILIPNRCADNSWYTGPNAWEPWAQQYDCTDPGSKPPPSSIVNNLAGFEDCINRPQNTAHVCLSGAVPPGTPTYEMGPGAYYAGGGGPPNSSSASNTGNGG